MGTRGSNSDTFDDFPLHDIVRQVGIKYSRRINYLNLSSKSLRMSASASWRNRRARCGRLEKVTVQNGVPRGTLSTSGFSQKHNAHFIVYPHSVSPSSSLRHITSPWTVPTCTTAVSFKILRERDSTYFFPVFIKIAKEYLIVNKSRYIKSI